MQRISYKLNVTVHRCLQGKAQRYLVDCCTPVSEVASRRQLRSASRQHLTVPRYRLNTFGRLWAYSPVLLRGTLYLIVSVIQH